jgi:hypothetical protein
VRIEEEVETYGPVVLTPEEHYAEAVVQMETAGNYGLDSPHRTNLILSALTHAMLGGLRDGLNYTAKVAAQEAAREASIRNEGEYTPPVFEEDDRP